MKKHWLVFILVFIFALSSCGGSEVNTVQTDTAESSQPEPDETVESPAVTDINIGESISLDFIEMSIEDFEINNGKEFSYSQATSFGKETRICSLDCPSGMKLVCLVGKLTNKTKSSIFGSNNPAEGLFIINANEYKTSLRCYNIEVADSKFEVADQETVDYFYYAEVPENVANNIESCVVYIGFVENLDASKWISDLSDYDYLYRLDVPASVL